MGPYHIELGEPCLSGDQLAIHELRLGVPLVDHGRPHGGALLVPLQVRGSAGGHVLRPALFGPCV